MYSAPDIENLLKECEQLINKELLPNPVKHPADNKKMNCLFVADRGDIEGMLLKPTIDLRNTGYQLNFQVPYPHLSPKPNYSNNKSSVN